MCQRRLRKKELQEKGHKKQCGAGLVKTNKQTNSVLLFTNVNEGKKKKRKEKTSQGKFNNTDQMTRSKTNDKKAFQKENGFRRSWLTVRRGLTDDTIRLIGVIHGGCASSSAAIWSDCVTVTPAPPLSPSSWTSDSLF